MLGAANDNVSTLSLYSKLPLTVHQSFSRSSQIILIAILLPLFISLAAPFALVADTLIHDPQARLILSDRPAAGAALVSAIFMLALLFCWPLYRLVVLATVERTIRIEGRMISVYVKSVFRSDTWSQAVPTYLGVAKGVRTTLSGVTHELLLVHADRRRTLVIASSNQPMHTEAQVLSHLLGLAEISTRSATSLPIPNALAGFLAHSNDPAIARI